MSELDFGQENYTNDEWVIDNDQSADWALQKIKTLETDTQKWEDFYSRKSEIVKNNNKFLIDRLKNKLFAYWQTQPHKGKTESVSLPSGKLMIKKQQPDYRRSEDDLKLWVSTNAKQFIKSTTMESVAWGELKKACERVGDTLVFKDTGEVVQGVIVVDREPVFEIKRYDGGVTEEEAEE